MKDSRNGNEKECARIILGNPRRAGRATVANIIKEVVRGEQVKMLTRIKATAKAREPNTCSDDYCACVDDAVEAELARLENPSFISKKIR